MMLSTANLLSPADGRPVVAPTQDMVLGCYYLTMDADRPSSRSQASASSPTRTRRSSPTSSGRRPGVTLHEPIEAEVRTWDARPPRLRAERDRTTVGRIIFNQILPDQLRFNNEVMKRSELKDLVDECYRLLGPDETAHLVDGIKSVGFEFATRGGMTIGLFDIEVPKRQGRAGSRRPTAQVAEIDRQFQRGLITEDERYEQVVEVWQKTTTGDVRRDDGRPRSDRAGHDDDRLRRPREQGQHRPARRDARPDGRPVGPDHRRPRAEQLPRGDDGPRVLHLHPRRPQGPRRHRPPDGRLGLPDPAPRRRGPGRHHPRGRLRHRGGQLDHPPTRVAATRRAPSGAGSSAGWPRPAARSVGQDQEGQGAAAHRRPQRGDHRGDRRARSTRPGSTRSSSAHR